LKRIVDLNADMGENADGKAFRQDEELVPLVTSASLACGFHAGDPRTLIKTVKLCRKWGVSVGAHPSFKDHEGFGRREMEVVPQDLVADLLYQISAVRGVAEALGMQLKHVKPHGALYNMACVRRDYANVVVRVVKMVSPSLILIGLPGSEMERVAKRERVIYAKEGFPERGYLSDGTLAPRTMKGALITDPDRVAERASSMVSSGMVDSIDGGEVRLSVDTLCVHSDTPGVVEIASAIRKKLKLEGVTVKDISSFLRSEVR